MPPKDDDIDALAENLVGHDNPEESRDRPGLVSYGLFRSRPASDWYAEALNVGTDRPRLLGELWLEGDLCLLFGDTGDGKSIFAMQVADAIARGVPVKPFTIDTPPQKVLYFDFELTTTQFTARYSRSNRQKNDAKSRTARRVSDTETGAAENGQDPQTRTSQAGFHDRYAFSPNLIRVEMLCDPPDPEDFGFRDLKSHFATALIDQIKRHGAKVVVIDKITYLAEHIHTTAGAAHMMKELRRVKAVLGLSVLIVGHRRPRRRLAPLALSDIAAGSPVADLADSVIAIAAGTCGPDIRYLKHLKSRNAKVSHDDQNVIVFRLSRETPEPQTPGAAPTIYVPPPPPERPSLISFNDLVAQHRRVLAAPPNSAIGNPPSAMPLFHHLGFSPESVHLIDNAKQAQQAERLERQQLRRSKNVVQMLMSREYKRYIEK